MDKLIFAGINTVNEGISDSTKFLLKYKPGEYIIPPVSSKKSLKSQGSAQLSVRVLHSSPSPRSPIGQLGSFSPPHGKEDAVFPNKSKIQRKLTTIGETGGEDPLSAMRKVKETSLPSLVAPKGNVILPQVKNA